MAPHAVAATVQPKVRDATKRKAHRSCLLELAKIAVAIVPQQLSSGFRQLAFIYPSRSGRKSRTLRRRLHSRVGVGLIPCARAAWFGMLLAFGWTVAPTVRAKRQTRSGSSFATSCSCRLLVAKTSINIIRR